MSPFKRIVYEWCMDDTKRNFLYTKNGNERHPGSTSIRKSQETRTTPQPIQELKKRIFKQYRCDACDTSEIIVDIDKMPRL
jgi:hypothetical protein